jgi:GNAT superfamily N-acetyltransferase
VADATGGTAVDLVDLDELPPAERVDLINRVHSELLVPNFLAAETVTLDTLRKAAAVAAGGTSITVGTEDTGQLVAAAIGDWFPNSRVLLLSYLVVRAERRAQRIGSALLRHALPAWSARYDPLVVLGELEDPRYHPPRAGQDPEARLRFYRRLGARVLDLAYTQPEVNPGHGRASNLLLIALPNGQGPDSALDAAVLLQFLIEYYRSVEGDGCFDDEFNALLSAVARQGHVPLRASEPAPGADGDGPGRDQITRTEVGS